MPLSCVGSLDFLHMVSVFCLLLSCAYVEIELLLEFSVCSLHQDMHLVFHGINGHVLDVAMTHVRLKAVFAYLQRYMGLWGAEGMACGSSACLLLTPNRCCSRG